LSGYVEVEGLDALLEEIGRDLAKERGDARLVVDEDARRAHPDGVDMRQVFGGAPDRVVDAVEMVLRVGVRLRLPNDFAGEDFLAVDHRRRFAVASPRVKPDAVTLQVPPDWRRAFLLFGESAAFGP